MLKINPFKVNDIVKRFGDVGNIYIITKIDGRKCYVREVVVGNNTTYVTNCSALYTVIDRNLHLDVPVVDQDVTPAKVECVGVVHAVPARERAEVLNTDMVLDAIRKDIPLQSYTSIGWVDVKFPKHLNVCTIEKNNYRVAPKTLKINDVEYVAPIDLKSSIFDSQGELTIYGVSINRDDVYPISVSHARYQSVKKCKGAKYWLKIEDAKAVLTALRNTLGGV